MIGAYLLFFFAASDDRDGRADPPDRGFRASGGDRDAPVRAPRAADARITPGAPPLLSFRAFEGKSRHRFGDLDLVLDDAGH